MRAYSWLILGSIAVACGGSAFTGSTEPATGGDGGDGDDNGGKAGALGTGGHAGKVASGGSTQAAGKSTGGVIGVAGDFGIAGDLVTGGSVSMAGEPGMAGAAGADPAPGPDAKCPVHAPRAGSACVSGLTCTYGTDVRTACRSGTSCEKGVWAPLTEPACKAIQACAAGVMTGTVCTAQAAACVKDGSELCSCSACVGTICGTKPNWHCAAVSGDAACPAIAPNQGQSCASKLSCKYGSCSLPQDIIAKCEAGAWDWSGEICPL